jgi:hypothetical protein
LVSPSVLANTVHPEGATSCDELLYSCEISAIHVPFLKVNMIREASQIISEVGSPKALRSRFRRGLERGGSWEYAI